MVRTVTRTALLLLWTTLVAEFATGQQVYWSPASGTLQQGKANRLQLHFEACSPQGDVELPNVAGIDFTKVGQSSSMNIFNSRVVQKIILEYQAAPSAEGDITIPGFQVETDEGKLQVQAAAFKVVAATVGNTGMRPEDIFKSELSAIENSIYEGEIFTLRYVLGVRQDYQNRLNDISPPQWNPLGIVTKGFENHRSTNFKYRNHNYSAILFESPAMATRNGTVKLPKVNQTVSMVVGRRRGFIFDDPVVDNYNIASETLELSIQPLPTGEPPSFTGAVGQFSFESNIVPEIVQIGEPITWTLKLSGTGNWPQGFSLNPRTVAASFRSIQPDINKEVSDDSPFEGSLTEDIVLIPTRDGDFQFGPVEFSFFNPKADRYETINIPPKTIVVNPLSQQNQSGSAVDDPSASTPPSLVGQASGRSLDLDPSGVNLLSKPAELLSAPLETGRSATLPSGDVRIGRLALSFIAPGILWLAIALVRSISMDPNRSRRQAFKELKTVSMALDDSESGLKNAQLAWRHAAKRYWGVEVEEPSPEDIANAVSKSLGQELAKRWKTLWTKSDSMLFGQRSPSFKEWQAELRDLLAHAKTPAPSLNRLLTSRAWFASLALAVVSISMVDSGSDEGTRHYNEVRFAAAHTEWLDQLETNTSDWAVRNNLGLAAAQQDNWGQAIAHWTSAFLLHSRHPDIKWNLEIGLTKSDGYYPTLARLVKGDGLLAYVSFLTPGQWEQVAYAFMILAGISFSAWVALAYYPGRKRARFYAAIIGIAAIATVFASEWARSQYGLLANPKALVAITEDRLKSVPTDLEVEQIESPLPQGSVCVATKSFLGWLKVALPNGEEGWSRKDNFSPLYGSIKDSFQ